MRRHRLVAAAPPRSGMNVTITVPPVSAPPAAAGPNPPASCPCGPIAAVWALYNETMLVTSVPAADTPPYRYLIAMGGVVPLGTSWESNSVWTPADPEAEGVPPQFDGTGTGATLSPWDAVTVQSDCPPGLLEVSISATCPDGTTQSANLRLIVSGGGYS